MIDLFTDCLRKFAKTYYVDVQNCGLMITVAIMINLFTDYLKKTYYVLQNCGLMIIVAIGQRSLHKYILLDYLLLNLQQITITEL